MLYKCLHNYVTMIICTKDILKFLNLGEWGKGII